MTTLEVLKRSFLFKSLTDDQVENIARLGQEKSFQAGEEIFKQGKKAKTLHILLNGQISVRIKDDEEADLMAKTLKEPGAVLGSVALVKPHVYNVTAEAVSKGRTFVIEGRRLSETMRANPIMGFAVMTCLSESYLHRMNVKRTGMISLFKAFRSQTHKSEVYDTYREVAYTPLHS